MTFDEIWNNALEAQSQWVSHQEIADRYEKDFRAEVKKLAEIVLPICEETIKAFKEHRGISISIEKDGISFTTTGKNGIVLKAKAYTGTGHEFDEWFDSIQEAVDLGKEFGAILEEKFKEKNIPLGFCRFEFPHTYFTK